MKKAGRLRLDGVMAALFLLLMAGRHTGNAAHEWLGVGLACLVAWHVWLNRHWFSTLFRGGYPASRMLRLVVNGLLFPAFLCALFSVLPISRTVFSFLGLEGGMFSRTLHVFSAHWAFLLAALHAGLYVRRVMPSGKVSFSPFARRGSGFVCAAFALYGVHAFPERDMEYVLTMRSAFMAWGGEDGACLLLMDYGAMFFLFAWAAWMCSRPGREGARHAAAALPTANGEALRETYGKRHGRTFVNKECAMKGMMRMLALAAVMGLCGHASAAEDAGQKVRVLFADGEAVVRLEDHPACRDFAAMLPLTVTFEDFNGTEKIAYLPEKLDTEKSPAGCDPSEGSFTYYAPWGNLAVFYRDFRPSSGLVPLGRVESGMEHFAGLEDGASVRMERMD